MGFEERDDKGRFLPGNGGRKAGQSSKEVLQALYKLTPKAVDKLGQILETEKDNRLVIRAIDLIMRYTTPVPKAELELSGPGGQPLLFSVDRPYRESREEWLAARTRPEVIDVTEVEH